MKQSVIVGAQLLWGGRYGCNNGSYGCTIVMSYIEINKAVSQWLLTFNLCVSVTWPLTCAFHIPCTHTPEIIDMHRGVCDRNLKVLCDRAFRALMCNKCYRLPIFVFVMNFEKFALINMQFCSNLFEIDRNVTKNTRAHLSQISTTIIADALATQGAMVSAGMSLT